MKTKEVQEKIIKNMRSWQKIEDAAVSITGQVMEKTDNAIVRIVMEIIQHDSKLHYLVQEMIADSLESKPLSLTPEEMADVWEMIERHLATEKRMVKLVEDSLAALKGRKMIVQEYLLNYLWTDERKHDKLLADFEKIKKNIYPYA